MHLSASPHLAQRNPVQTTWRYCLTIAPPAVLGKAEHTDSASFCAGHSKYNPAQAAQKILA